MIYLRPAPLIIVGSRRQRQDRADAGKDETCAWRNPVCHPFGLSGAGGARFIFCRRLRPREQFPGRWRQSGGGDGQPAGRQRQRATRPEYANPPKVFRERTPGSKNKSQLFDYASCFDEPVLADLLIHDAGFEQARNFRQLAPTPGQRHSQAYFARNINIPQIDALLSLARLAPVDDPIVQPGTPGTPGPLRRAP